MTNPASDPAPALTEEDAANALAALGHPARLAVFRLLVRANPDGARVGEIGAHLGIAGATLTHHLSTLVQAGLVTQEKRGREIINRADTDAMDRLTNFLTAECCAGLGDPKAQAPDHAA